MQNVRPQQDPRRENLRALIQSQMNKSFDKMVSERNFSLPELLKLEKLIGDTMLNIYTGVQRLLLEPSNETALVRNLGTLTITN